MTSENWSWGKLFKGLFDGKNTAKALVLAWHLILVGGIIYLAVLGVLTLKSKMSPTPDVISAETASVDKSQKSLQVINWPLAHLFHMGSSDKVTDNQ